MMKVYVYKEYEKDDYDNYYKNLTKKDVIDKLRYIARGYLPDYHCTYDEEDFYNYTLQATISKVIELLNEDKK